MLHKAIIKKILSSSVSSIHISFDMCTSSNNLVLLAVVGYWLDELNTIHHGLIGFRWLLGVHSGENQGAIVWSVIQDYEIRSLFGYFTLDNGGNNMTALRYILNRIRSALLNFLSTTLPPITLVPPPVSIQLTHTSRYISYYGHILNLIVKVFLYGKRSVQLLASDNQKQVEKENIDMKRWRKIGPLSKLRILTV